MELNRVARWFVEGVCGYEFAALVTGRLPSVTRISWAVRRNPLGLSALVALLAWLTWHILGQGR